MPVGDYCMPLNFRCPEYNESEDLRQMTLILPILNGDEVFKMDKETFGKQFVYDVIAEGTWNNGKFTGKAESQYERRGPHSALSAPCDQRFTPEWIDGIVSARLTTEFGKYDWHDGVCDVELKSEVSNNHFKEKYTTRDGKKEGLYIKEVNVFEFGYGTYCRPVIEAEYENGLLNGNYKEYSVENGILITDEQYVGGKKHGVCKKFNKERGWLESETPYVDGKKHGFEKLYNSDGTVSEMKYWQNGKDCTAKYEKLKKIATKRIEKEKQIEEETGIKTRFPKMSKFEKTAAVVKEKLGLSK